MTTREKIEKALEGTALAVNNGAYLRHGRHYNAKGQLCYGWARYSAAGECVYLGNAERAVREAGEERAEIARQTHGVTAADLASL